MQRKDKPLAGESKRRRVTTGANGTWTKKGPRPRRASFCAAAKSTAHLAPASGREGAGRAGGGVQGVSAHLQSKWVDCTQSGEGRSGLRDAAAATADEIKHGAQPAVYSSFFFFTA